MARFPHPMLRRLGNTIRSLRQQQGLSQEALADLARIDRSYMSSIERGLRNVSVLNVARVAFALQVPMCDLLQAKGAMPVGGIDRMRGVKGSAKVMDLHPRKGSRAEQFDWEPGRYLSIG